MPNPIFARALFVLAVFLAPLAAKGKADDSQSESGTAPRELHRVTRTIRQDRQGNIWIATFGGVFRYDGQRFTNITSRVSSDPFFSVLEDRKGNFWFSSLGSGVYRYDGRSFRQFTTRDGLGHNDVTEIYEDKAGNIWFATRGGASRYDGKSMQNYRRSKASAVDGVPGEWLLDFTGREKPPADGHDDVNTIAEDRTGKFWVGTRGHAYVHDGKSATVIRHKGWPFTNVRSIIADKKGNVWLGAANGLWRYDGSAFTQITSDFVGYVYEDSKENIWTSSQSALGWMSSPHGTMPWAGKESEWVLSRHGTMPSSGKEPEVARINPGKGMLFGILEARDGSIWFGTGSGAIRYNGQTFNDFTGQQARE
jgi:ligand-binding sensor domain-containing protein